MPVLRSARQTVLFPRKPAIIVSGGVSVTAIGTKNYTANGGGLTSKTIASGLINVPVGKTNTALLAMMWEANAAADFSGTTVTWNGSTMTLVGQATGGTGRLAMFGMLNPPTGDNQLVIGSWAAPGELFVDALAFDGVTQASVAAAFAHFTSNTNTARLAVTSQVNDFVVCMQANTTTLVIDPTALTGMPDNTTGAVISAGGNYAAGASSVSLGTSSGNVPLVNIGCDVVHA